MSDPTFDALTVAHGDKPGEPHRNRLVLTHRNRYVLTGPGVFGGAQGHASSWLLRLGPDDATSIAVTAGSPAEALRRLADEVERQGYRFDRSPG